MSTEDNLREGNTVGKIFIVRITTENAGSIRLVEAESKNAAIKHVVGGMISADVANQHTLVQAVQNGIKVEKADAPASGAAQST